MTGLNGTSNDNRREDPDALALGPRLRARRLQAGLTAKTAAKATGVTLSTLRRWELGHGIPRPHRLWKHAQTLGCPVASLLTDELILAEVRVSPETLERVKREGQPAAREAAERIARGLEVLLLAEAGRPPLDLSPGARPKRRRSRLEVLAGIAEAQRMTKAREARAREARRIE